MATKDSILQQIAAGIVDGNYEKTVELCEHALKEGHGTSDIIINGLSAGMTQSGKTYGKKGMFLDSILWSAAVTADRAPGNGASASINAARMVTHSGMIKTLIVWPSCSSPRTLAISSTIRTSSRIPVRAAR